MIDVALIGPLKVMLIGLLIYFWYRWVWSEAEPGLKIPFFVVPVLGTLVLLFLLLLGIYDKLVVTLLGILVFLFPYLIRYRHSMDLSQIRKDLLFGLLRYQENPKRKVISSEFRTALSRVDLKLVGLPVLAVAFLLTTRYLLLHFDAYTLSEIWLYDVGMVRSLNDQSWLYHADFVSVELLFINLYHMITGISEEMALHTFGLIENAVLALVIYRLVSTISGTRNLVPFIAVSFFALGIAFLPMTVSILQEHNASYLACCFALPLAGYAMKGNHTGKAVIVLIALSTTLVVCLVHAFTGLVMLGLLLLSALLISAREIRPLVGRIFLGWMAGILVAGIGLWFFCYLRGLDFQSSMASRFIAINSYEYYPQLRFPWPFIREYYLYLATTGILLGVFLAKKNKQLPHREITVLVWGMAMLGLGYLEVPWLDQALVNQSLTIALVLMLGALLSLLLKGLALMPIASSKVLPISASLLSLIILFSLSGFTALEKREHDPLKEEILAVYYELGTSHLPYTYAVVNQTYGQQLSYDEHDFVNYDDFANTYLQRDSLYHVHKKNIDYLKSHPEVILPESVFVFMSKNSIQAERRLLTPTATRSAIEKVLGSLVAKGREVSLYSEGEYLQVYEILNKKNATTLNDLILGL